MVVCKRNECSKTLFQVIKSLYNKQESTVRTIYGGTDWFKIFKKAMAGWYAISFLFSLYTKAALRNFNLNQFEIEKKNSGRKVNNRDIYIWHHSTGRKWRGCQTIYSKAENEKVGCI